MKGFEIQINNDSPIVVATDRKAFVLLNCINNDYCRLDAVGSDSMFRNLKWLIDRKLQLGDKLRIKVVETDCSSECIKPIVDMSRKELEELYEKKKSYLIKKGVLK